MESPSDSLAPIKISANEAARLRRERRQAKIAAGGRSRLNAITSLSGRSAPAPETTPTSSQGPSPKPTSPAVVASTHHDDPDEVDISASEHYYRPTPSRTPSNRSQNAPGLDPQLQALMQAQLQQGQTDGANEDPMMKMLQQMVGGGGMPGQEGQPQMPEGMEGLAQMFGATSGQPQASQPASSSAYLWRIVHAITSLLLALYVALFSSFTGSMLSRTAPVAIENENAHIGRWFFTIFATAEILLQSSRYFLEKGQLPPSGFLGGMAQMLPEPYAGYLRVIGRYSVIYRTVVADAMVVVFVLGAVAWWKGAVVA